MVTAAFHLNNREAARGKPIPTVSDLEWMYLTCLYLTWSGCPSNDDDDDDDDDDDREAKRELKVYNVDRLLPFCPTPAYLGVKLDRLLTFRHHLVALRKKLSSRVTLLRRLVDLGWGAGVKTLQTAVLSVVYSTAEYCCAPIRCRSTHTRLIDCALNDTLRIVSGCLCSTLTNHLLILSGIQ